jgi:putative transposase
VDFRSGIALIVANGKKFRVPGAPDFSPVIERAKKRALAPAWYVAAMQPAPQSLRTFHVTSSTAGRKQLLLAPERAALLIKVMQENREKRRFQLHAYAIMPNHIHVLLTPAQDVSIEKAVQYIKGGYSFQLKSKFPVWSTSFNDTRIASGTQFVNCIAYIHSNPVETGFVKEPSEWPYSSAHESAVVDPMPEWFRPNRG